ncbi:hypothetical protein A2U01_0095669 [Trifolium medium]|uniref:Uncharacterized protein n=1 Tax=Trifolium medium TaxID=97028 RepID=A0A392URL3_9FABA|nr:hypothetical protein [Trifolium medium]
MCSSDFVRYQSVLDNIKYVLTTKQFNIAGPVLVQHDSEVKKNHLVFLIRFVSSTETARNPQCSSPSTI